MPFIYSELLCLSSLRIIIELVKLIAVVEGEYVFQYHKKIT